MVVLVLAVISCVASVSDARSRIIPNEASFLIAVTGLALQLVRTFMPHALELLVLTGPMADLLPLPVVCVASATGILVVGVAFEALLRRFGRQGMGLGDVKFIAAWACALGWYVAPGLAVACLLGAVHALVRRERTFAMAPWLTLSFVVTGVGLMALGYLG